MKFASDEACVAAMGAVVRECIAASIRCSKSKDRRATAWAAADAADCLEQGRLIAESSSTINFEQPLSILQSATERAFALSRKQGNLSN